MITTDQIDRLRRNMQPNNQKAMRGNPHAPAFPRRFVAADFYPHASENFTTIPMIGSSRFIRVGNTARKVNFATVSPPFAEWHRNSDYPGRVSMTEDEFILTNPTFLPA